MKRSSTRILTTHTGSLSKPQGMLELLLADQTGNLDDRSSLNASVREAESGVVNQQVNSGLDIINDGEQGRVDYTVFVKDPLTGFEGESTPPIGAGDQEFPELAELLRPFASPFQTRPPCFFPVAGGQNGRNGSKLLSHTKGSSGRGPSAPAPRQTP